MVSELTFYIISIGLLIPRLDKVKVSRYGAMVPCTRAGGETTNPMVKAASFMLTETFKMATGKMARLTVSVFNRILMAFVMRGTGRKASCMVMANSNGLMVQGTKANT